MKNEKTNWIEFDDNLNNDQKKEIIKMFDYYLKRNELKKINIELLLMLDKKEVKGKNEYEIDN